MAVCKITYVSNNQTFKPGEVRNFIIAFRRSPLDIAFGEPSAHTSESEEQRKEGRMIKHNMKKTNTLPCQTANCGCLTLFNNDDSNSHDAPSDYNFCFHCFDRGTPFGN